jgi:hypothetical protein
VELRATPPSKEPQEMVKEEIAALSIKEIEHRAKKLLGIDPSG